MIIRNEMMATYHANKATSASKLKVFRESPLLYHKVFNLKSVEPKRTAALDEGAGFDSLLFDTPKQFADNYVCEPETYVNDKGETKPWHNGANACKAWNVKMELECRTILAHDKMKDFALMREAINHHPLASALLSQGEAQVVFRRHSDKYDIDVQVRPDWFSEKPLERPDLGLSTGGLPYIVDLKTTEKFGDWFDACDPEDPRQGSPVWKFGYHRQGGLCQWVAFQDCGRTAHFLLVVEKHEPFRVGVIALNDEYLDLGWESVEMDLQRLAKCQRENRWPGSPEHVLTLAPPIFLLDKGVREAAAHAGWSQQ